ncbi:protein pygopus-like isoform X1 [Amphibalanus amphitrite]|uniref:protein pygopus-like isoform X1 n=1 Tax=Amphibalanus amphitrite TaxID=1232801 RepID=UPI001C9287F8|nr:protein pygopus-like isoform X1 [Amphibalanus amphitrite]
MAGRRRPLSWYPSHTTLFLRPVWSQTTPFPAHHGATGTGKAARLFESVFKQDHATPEINVSLQKNDTDRERVDRIHNVTLLDRNTTREVQGGSEPRLARLRETQDTDDRLRRSTNTSGTERRVGVTVSIGNHPDIVIGASHATRDTNIKQNRETQQDKTNNTELYKNDGSRNESESQRRLRKSRGSVSLQETSKTFNYTFDKRKNPSVNGGPAGIMQVGAEAQKRGGNNTNTTQLGNHGEYSRHGVKGDSRCINTYEYNKDKKEGKRKHKDYGHPVVSKSYHSLHPIPAPPTTAAPESLTKYPRKVHSPFGHWVHGHHPYEHGPSRTTRRPRTILTPPLGPTTQRPFSGTGNESSTPTARPRLPPRSQRLSPVAHYWLAHPTPATRPSRGALTPAPLQRITRRPAVHSFEDHPSHPNGHPSHPTGHSSHPTGHSSHPTGHPSHPTGHSSHPTRQHEHYTDGSHKDPDHTGHWSGMSTGNHEEHAKHAFSKDLATDGRHTIHSPFH